MEFAVTQTREVQEPTLYTFKVSTEVVLWAPQLYSEAGTGISILVEEGRNSVAIPIPCMPSVKAWIDSILLSLDNFEVWQGTEFQKSDVSDFHNRACERGNTEKVICSLWFTWIFTESVFVYLGFFFFYYIHTHFLRALHIHRSMF